MATASRRDEHKELTRRAVLDAAGRQFAEHGFIETPIDAVARSARVSKGGLLPLLRQGGPVRSGVP